MKYMMTYDMMETARNTNEWLGATARAMASYPAFAMWPHPGMALLKAWGEVTERSFARMAARPDWGIPSIPGEDGKDHVVSIRKVMEKPFGDLIHFRCQGRHERPRKVLLVAPMSGHYATLLRKTVISMLPDCEVYITDWTDARMVSVIEGRFDLDDYVEYVREMIAELGPDVHVVAVCQPGPPTLAAIATALVFPHRFYRERRPDPRDAGPIEVYCTSFKPMQTAFAGRPDRVLMKLVVCAETRRVLGCHIVSPNAGEMIQLAGIAVKMGATKEDFDRTVAVHPTISEELVTMRAPVRTA